MEWQPIETAPKDGTAILVFPPSSSAMQASIAKWDEDKYANKPIPYWRRMDALGKKTFSRSLPPTHWMPLPPPPSE